MSTPAAEARPASRARVRRKKKSDYLIQSVSNALDVLEALGRHPEEMGVTELAKQLHLHKNNVFRLLATLQTRGYVEQNTDSENYRLGLACMELGRGFLQQTRLLRHARGVLEEIAGRLGETAHVAVRQGEEAVYLDGVESDRTLRVVARPGLTRPLHASAEGKVLAAFDPVAAAAEATMWAARPLRRFTAKTCVDPQRLAEEIKEVASRGWAIDHGEVEDGICNVATPVRDHTGRVAAALSVSVPATRATVRLLEEELVHFLRDAAARLSHRLGFREPPAPD